MQKTILLVLLSCLHSMLFGQESYTAPETGQLLIEACEGTLYDSGGAEGDYTDDNQSTVIIEGDEGDFMTLTFSAFALENGFDFMVIFSGMADDGDVIGTYTGSNLPNDGAPIEIPNNVVSILFYSDYIIADAGYALDFSCFTNDQVPVANVVYPTFSCNGIVGFSDESTGFPTSWNWDFGDGATSTEQNPVHTYNAPGEYTVSLEACNDNGCATFTGTTPINFDPENEICNGGINIPAFGQIETTACTGILFDSGGPDGNYTEGNYGSILIAPTSSAGITITFSEFDLGNDGEHSDILFIVDGETHMTLASYSGTELPNGGAPITFNVSSIIVYLVTDHFNNFSGFTMFWEGAGTAEPPVAAFSVSSTTVPLNTPINFVDESQNAPGEWLWNFGDGTTSELQNPTYAFTTPGTYEVTLEVTNCNSSATADPITITVLPAPELTFNPTSFDVTLEAGTTLTENINVCNVGEGPLVFNLSGGGGDSGLGYTFGFVTNENGADFSWNVMDMDFNVIAENTQDYEANQTYVETIGGLMEDGTYYLSLIAPEGVQALELFQWIDPVSGEVLFEQNIETHPDLIWLLPPPMPGDFGDWLSVESTETTLEPGQCIDIPVTFDATDLFAGVYEGQINITSNDPNQAVSNIPVTMTVTGAPQIAVSPQDLDFGALQVGASSTLEFTISNNGTDELSLAGLTSAESAFALSSADGLTLAPQTSQMVLVTFSPPAVADYATTLTLENNAGDPVLVNLSGSGVPAPAITINPNAFEVELIAGEDTTLVTNIGNVGEAVLNYDIQSSSDANGFLFEFTTDFFGYEFSWTLTDSQGAVILNSSDTEYEGNTEYSVPLTGLLSSESYTLNLFDSFGDGALPSFKVTDLSTGGIIAQGSFTTPDNPFELTLELGSPAGDILSVDPESGSVEINQSQAVNINLESEGLATGTYNIDVLVASNDPVQPEAIVDITLHVIAPVATDFAVGNTFVCGLVATEFTDLTANTATSWNWYFGDGTISEEQNPTYTYTEDGVYTVTLISCNSLGCDTLTRENYITVETDCYTQNIPTGHETEIITVCEGNVYDSGGPNGDYLEGNFGILTIAPEGATQLSITFSEFDFANDGDRLLIFDGYYGSGDIIGEYTGNELEGITITASSGVLTLFEYTGHFNQKPGFAASFSCNSEPVAPFANFTITGNEGLLCANEALLFTDGSSGNPTEWFWDFGDGVTSNLENPAHTYAESGAYTVQLTTCNLVGCDTEVKEVVVEVDPDCEINNIPDELYGQAFILGCNGSLFDSGGADEPHLDNILSSVTIISPSPNLAIAFTEFDMGEESYVFVYDGADIFAPLIGTYTGNELPEGGASIIASGNILTIYEYTGNNSTDNAGFALDYFCQQDFTDPEMGMRISNGEMCDGIMSFRTPDGMPVDTWYWDFGDGSTSTEATPTHEFPHHGAYEVRLEACYQGDCTEYVSNVYSNKITPEIGAANLVTVGTEVNFTGLTDNVTHWNWDFGNGMTADHATPTIVYDEPGEYDVHIHMINMNVHETCDAEHTHRITIVEDGTTSTEELQEQSIRVYPNPTRDILNVDMGTMIASDVLIRIYNMDGRLVRQLNYQAAEISVEDLSAGTYLLEIIQDAEAPQRIPFVKVK